MLTIGEFCEKILSLKDVPRIAIVIRHVDAPIDDEPEKMFGIIPGENVSPDGDKVFVGLVVSFLMYLNNKDYDFEFITPNTHSVVDGKLVKNTDITTTPTTTTTTPSNMTVH